MFRDHLRSFSSYYIKFNTLVFFSCLESFLTTKKVKYDDDLGYMLATFYSFSWKTRLQFCHGEECAFFGEVKLKKPNTKGLHFVEEKTSSSLKHIYEHPGNTDTLAFCAYPGKIHLSIPMHSRNLTGMCVVQSSAWKMSRLSHH